MADAALYWLPLHCFATHTVATFLVPMGRCGAALVNDHIVAAHTLLIEIPGIMTDANICERYTAINHAMQLRHFMRAGELRQLISCRATHLPDERVSDRHRSAQLSLLGCQRDVLLRMAWHQWKNKKSPKW